MIQLVTGRPIGGSLSAGGVKPHILVIDGSQLGGSRTDIPSYGTLDLTLVGAASNAIPSGVVLVRDGTTKVAYDTVHGIEPGLIRAAQVAGLTTGLKVLTRVGSSLSIATIISTTWPLAVTDMAAEALNAGGFDPSLIIYATGGPDALTNATVAAWEMQFRALKTLILATCPHAAIMVSGLMSTDLGSFPKAVELRAAAKVVLDDPTDNRTAYWDPIDYQGQMQPDATHLTSSGLVNAGMNKFQFAQRRGACHWG